MKIHVTVGTGCASTELAAFDRALFNAGIANFNLVTLSSVIPAGAEVEITEPDSYTADGGWGDRLYIVLAESRTSVPNESAWAGIGWVIDSSGQGLFVEFEGSSEKYVRESISHSLKDLLETRGMDAVETNMVVTGTSCHDAPACALVAAVYRSEPW
jgi:arginine decarboxylase